MSQRVSASRVIRSSIAAIFASLVFVATTIFSIYVPQTRGFFNIGETMVYTTALLFGPIIGAFAGGVGSMLADLFLGYPHYAPATLVIKACEGIIVGTLSRKRIFSGSSFQWKAFTLILGLITGVLLGIVGSLYYSGSMELYLGFPPPTTPTQILFVPPEFWYAVGAIVVALISLMGFVFEPEFGWLIFSIMIGGLEMIVGYFLYQQFFLGVLAVAEIPVNIGQMTIGLIVSIPIVRAVRRSFPSLKF
jgi:uncharacterized membrane protein